MYTAAATVPPTAPPTVPPTVAPAAYTATVPPTDPAIAPLVGVCAVAEEGSDAALDCGPGRIIKYINMASYGTQPLTHSIEHSCPRVAFTEGVSVLLYHRNML